MNCRDITEHASAYLDAELTGWRRLAFRVHLLMCRLCREYVRQMDATIAVLRRTPAPDPALGEDARAALLAAFRGRDPGAEP